MYIDRAMRKLHAGRDRLRLLTELLTYFVVSANGKHHSPVFFADAEHGEQRMCAFCELSIDFKQLCRDWKSAYAELLIGMELF